MTIKELVMRKFELERNGLHTDEARKEYFEIEKQLKTLKPEALVYSPYFIK